MILAYGTPILVYCDIDTDIGADFNDTRYRVNTDIDTRYRCTPDDIGVYPISGIPDIGVYRYRHNITIYRYRRLPEIGYTQYPVYPISVYTDIGIISQYTDIGVYPRSGIPDIGYTGYRVYPIPAHHHNIPISA
jgi:hypothetical protein